MNLIVLYFTQLKNGGKRVHCYEIFRKYPWKIGSHTVCESYPEGKFPTVKKCKVFVSDLDIDQFIVAMGLTDGQNVGDRLTACTHFVYSHPDHPDTWFSINEIEIISRVDEIPKNFA